MRRPTYQLPATSRPPTAEGFPVASASVVDLPGGLTPCPGDADRGLGRHPTFSTAPWPPCRNGKPMGTHPTRTTTGTAATRPGQARPQPLETFEPPNYRRKRPETPLGSLTNLPQPPRRRFRSREPAGTTPTAWPFRIAQAPVRGRGTALAVAVAASGVGVLDLEVEARRPKRPAVAHQVVGRGRGDYPPGLCGVTSEHAEHPHQVESGIRRLIARVWAGRDHRRAVRPGRLQPPALSRRRGRGHDTHGQSSVLSSRGT